MLVLLPVMYKSEFPLALLDHLIDLLKLVTGVMPAHEAGSLGCQPELLCELLRNVGVGYCAGGFRCVECDDYMGDREVDVDGCKGKKSSERPKFALTWLSVGHGNGEGFCVGSVKNGPRACQ